MNLSFSMTSIQHSQSMPQISPNINKSCVNSFSAMPPKYLAMTPPNTMHLFSPNSLPRYPRYSFIPNPMPPVLCPPNSTLQYSPLQPANFIPVVGEKGWTMVPVDKHGNPITYQGIASSYFLQP